MFGHVEGPFKYLRSPLGHGSGWEYVRRGMSFNALVLSEADGKITAAITQLEESSLPRPDNSVTVAVEYSSLNYKDGMILQGIGRLVREYPHIPGVDLAGTVTDSSDGRYAIGDQVLCTGWRVGESHWGGYAQKCRLNGDWLVPLPKGMTTKRRDGNRYRRLHRNAVPRCLGTERRFAGHTHSRHGSIGRRRFVRPHVGGGHGASHGGQHRPHGQRGCTPRLGAAQVIDRAEIAEAPAKPLLKERWAGCVDAVGGDTLAHVLAEMNYGGSVAACGLAGGNSLNTTVIPFLLRGVKLLGIDSVMASFDERLRIWTRIADVFDAAKLAAITTEVDLADIADLSSQILAGQTTGRTVVNTQR